MVKPSRKPSVLIMEKDMCISPLKLGSKMTFGCLVIYFLFFQLQQAATCLSKIEQSPCSSLLESMQPFPDAVVKPELLKHQDGDVNLLVATCVIEITRVAASKAPYSDTVLKVHF